MTTRRNAALNKPTVRGLARRFGRFAAIDFETADHGRDSACSLAVVVVEGLEVVGQSHFLIRPPRRQFVFSHVHGITYADVVDKPPFREVWPQAKELLENVQFIAAHSATFDRSVLFACCRASGQSPPAVGFQCTVKLARQAWGIHPTRLPDVCRHLGIPLQHHCAESDALACARIVIAARREQRPLNASLGEYWS